MTKNVINPTAMIELAKQGAQTKADSESLKKEELKKQAEKKKSDSLDDRTDTLLAELNNIIKKGSDNKSKTETVIEKKAEESPEKVSTAAAAIKIQMQTEAVNEKVADELNKGPEPEKEKSVLKLARNFDYVNIQELNEKVASAGKYAFMGTAGKIIAGGLAGASLFAGGTALERKKGSKKLKTYIEADQKRDTAVTQQAFRSGQLNVLKRVRDALNRSKGETRA